MAREEVTLPAVVPATTIRKYNIIRVHNEAVAVLGVVKLDNGDLRIRYMHKSGQDSIEVGADSSVFRFSLKEESR